MLMTDRLVLQQQKQADRRKNEQSAKSGAGCGSWIIQDRDFLFYTL